MVEAEGHCFNALDSERSGWLTFWSLFVKEIFLILSNVGNNNHQLILHKKMV